MEKREGKRKSDVREKSEFEFCYKSREKMSRGWKGEKQRFGMKITTEK